MALPHSRYARGQVAEDGIPANFKAVVSDFEDNNLDEFSEWNARRLVDDDEYIDIEDVDLNEADDEFIDEENFDYYNDMYFEDDFYGDDANMDGVDELWDYQFGSKYFDNNNVFDAEKCMLMHSPQNSKLLFMICIQLSMAMLSDCDCVRIKNSIGRHSNV